MPIEANPPFIRPAQEQDIPELRHIAETTELFSGEMLDAMMAGYLDGSKRDVWFVATRDGRPMAFGFCEPECMTEGTWNLLALGVLPDEQGSGIGARMLRHLEALLTKQGERILLVETMGTAEFERTRAFYRRNGYVEEARIRAFYAAGADKLVFWKHL